MSDHAEDGWAHERNCAALEAEIRRFLVAAEQADPAIPVPTCPGWTVADLVKHHGTTHRWIEHIVRRRAQERIWSREVDLGLPDDEAHYPAWLATGVGPLLATLREIDPDTPLWTWGADRHARFWPRRLLHEAAIHCADAELALGGTPRIEPDTAVDGVDEFLANLPYAHWVAPRLRQLPGDGATLHLHATDCDGEWMITIGADGFTWSRGHGKGTVAVRATASDLMLLVYGRLQASDERLTVYGDQRLLAQWLEKTAF